MKPKLHPTRNDLPESTRREVVDLLNQNLAGILDLGLQAKQAHWNVKGPNFIGLHELFDKVAEELEEFADEIAERAVELGGVAQGTVLSDHLASDFDGDGITDYLNRRYELDYLAYGPP